MVEQRRILRHLLGGPVEECGVERRSGRPSALGVIRLAGVVLKFELGLGPVEGV